MQEHPIDWACATPPSKPSWVLAALGAALEGNDRDALPRGTHGTSTIQYIEIAKQGATHWHCVTHTPDSAEKSQQSVVPIARCLASIRSFQIDPVEHFHTVLRDHVERRITKYRVSPMA